MRKNKLLLASAAIAATMLTACTDQTEFSQADLQNAAQEAADGQIQFGTYMGKASTRAWDATTKQQATSSTDAKYKGGVINTSVLQAEAEFGVFGYQTGSADWASNTFQADFMYNQYIKANWKSGTPDSFDSWTYEPVKYWPNGIDLGNTGNGGNPSKDATEAGIQKLSFFAYAPYTASATTVNTPYTEASGPYGDYPDGLDKDKVFQTTAYKATSEIDTQAGVVGMTGWSTTTAVTKDPWLNYVLYNSSTESGIDLLWGLRGQYSYAETDNEPNEVSTLGSEYNVNLTKQNVPEKVRFLFKHALAKFGGATQKSGGGDEPAQSGLYVVVDVDGNSTNAGEGMDNTDYFGSEFSVSKTLVTLNSVKIRDTKTYSEEPGTTLTGDQHSNLKTAGWFNIATGKWANTTVWNTTTNEGAAASLVVDNTGTTGVPQLNRKIKEIGIGSGNKELISEGGQWTDDASTNKPIGVTTTRTPVYDNNNYPGLMLIPSDEVRTLYVTVDYFVRTADKQLAKGYSEVEQIITNKVDLKGLEANKYYSLVIHLGLTSVKFEAVVADWATTADATYDENGKTNESGELETESVWLPSNVVNTTTITAAAGTEHKVVNVAADQTSYTLNLTGLKEGNTVNAASSSAGIESIATATYTSGSAVQSDGKASISITLKPNNTTDVVTNTVTVTETKGASGTEPTKATTLVTIKQAAGVLTLSAPKTVVATGNTFEVEATNGTYKVPVATPATITVTGGTPSSSAQKSGAGNEHIAEITVPENKTSNKITWNVAIKANAESNAIANNVDVIQNACELVISITTGTETNSGTYASETLTFEKGAIDAKPTYTVQDKQDTPTNLLGIAQFSTTASWLSVNVSDGRLKASANKTGAERSATVTVKANDATKTFTVTQKGA